MRRVPATLWLVGWLGCMTVCLNSSVQGQSDPGFRAGGHVSINPAGFEAREHRLGAHLIVPVLGVLEVSPAVGYYLGDDFTGTAWQLAGSVRVRPFAPGTDSPVYVGLGASMLSTSRNSRLYDIEVLGLEFRTGGISLFGELLYYGLIDLGPTTAGALNVALGFNVPL